ncbi:hypothetical protein BKA80DRAFT_287228 [Phyllosticta citrichinensis]
MRLLCLVFIYLLAPLCCWLFFLRKGFCLIDECMGRRLQLCRLFLRGFVLFLGAFSSGGGRGERGEWRGSGDDVRWYARKRGSGGVEV